MAVHGGVIPLFYDWHFGMVVSAADRPISRTAYLHVDYRDVTPVDTPLTPWPHRTPRRPQGLHHGDHDRRRRHRAQRGQRPDGPAAAPPTLNPKSSPRMTMQFTVPAVLDAVAATIGDREFCSPRATGVTATRRSSSGPTGSPHICIRAGWAAHRARRPGRSRGRTGPAGHLRLQRQRVPRGDARRVQGTGRAVQRQLPLRRRRAAVPARRLRATARRLPLRLRAARRRGPARTCRTLRCSCRSPTTRATTCCPGRSSTRRRWPPRAPSRRRVEPSPDDLYMLYTGGTTGMPKGVLWRQADIFLTPRWPDLDAARPPSRDELADRGGGRTRRQALPAAAVHARRRPLAGVQRLTTAAPWSCLAVDHLDADDVVARSSASRSTIATSSATRWPTARGRHRTRRRRT